jgi:cytochrome c556
MLLMTAVAIAVSAGVASAQVKKGKSRPTKTGQWMRGVVKPHCEAIKKGLETPPADDKAWEQLAVNAAVLNETSFILMDDGRCPDGVWANASTKTLREGTVALLAAIEQKDAGAAKTAFGHLASSCKECHEKHKEK